MLWTEMRRGRVTRVVSRAEITFQLLIVQLVVQVSSQPFHSSSEHLLSTLHVIPQIIFSHVSTE